MWHLSTLNTSDPDNNPDNNPLPPTQKPRGFGGVSILYRKNMNLKVKRLPVGDNRITAVEVLSSPPLYVCKVYMPSRNSKGDKEGDSYRICLDQLSEILSTCGKRHAVLFLEDLNASLVTRPGNQQDVPLKQFVEANRLLYKQTGENTFFHPNKHDKAEIDYILFNDLDEEVVTSVEVQNKDALNTSGHIPVIATLCISAGKTQPTIEMIKCKSSVNQGGRNVINRLTNSQSRIISSLFLLSKYSLTQN